MSGVSGPTAWLVAFAITVLVEVPAYLAGLAVLGWRPARAGLRSAALVVGLNLVTHPLLWWASQHVAWGVVLGGLEPAAVVVEGGLLAWLLRRPVAWCLLLALGANAASLAVGIGFLTLTR